MTDRAGDEAATVAAALEKLRAFIEGLPDAERQVLAALLAPAVAQAYTAEVEEAAEVAGFGMGTAIAAWAPAELPAALAERLRSMHWNVTADPAD